MIGVLTAALLLASAQNGNVPVAGVDTSIGAENAVNVLMKHGIGAAVEGSIMYGVTVMSPDKARATKILMADAKERPYNYITINGYGDLPKRPAVAAWPVRRFNPAIKDLSDARVQADANLKGLIEAAHQMFPKMGPVDEVAIYQVKYWNKKGILSDGYYGAVTGHSTRSTESWVANVASWDGGKAYVFLSGTSKRQ